MSSAFIAQASGSPPGSLTTWAAMRDGRISASPSSSVKFSTSSANAAISRIWIARAARAAGIRADAFSGVSFRLCRICARSLALAAKNMSLISAASLGRIDRFDAIRSSASVGVRAGRRGRRGRWNLRAAERHRLVGMGAPQSELAQIVSRRCRIDREPRPHRGAGGVVDLVDQAGGQLDELPLLVGRMGSAPAHRDRSARAAASGGCRRPRDGRASSARRNPETMELRSCQGCTRLLKMRFGNVAEPSLRGRL